jgi:hypothetical protein
MAWRKYNIKDGRTSIVFQLYLYMNAYMFVYAPHEGECFPLTVIGNKALSAGYTCYKANCKKA